MISLHDYVGLEASSPLSLSLNICFQVIYQLYRTVPRTHMGHAVAPTYLEVSYRQYIRD